MSKGIDKFLNLMKLNDSDEDYEDDLFEEEEDKPVMSFFSRKGKAAEEDKEDTVVSSANFSEKKRAKAATRQGTSKLVPVNNSRGAEVYVIKPQEFNEAQIVADFLKDSKTIVINMEGIEIYAAQRIIDFISGACYALNGSLQAISNNIFIAAPEAIEVSGDLREEILNDNMLAPELGKFRV